ncbi:MAG: hypothetical protein ACR2NP_21535 [Pirellulaceae bacterium]
MSIRCAVATTLCCLLILGATCCSEAQETTKKTDSATVIGNFVSFLGGEMPLRGLDRYQVHGTFSGDHTGEFEVRFFEGKHLVMSDTEGQLSIEYSGFDGQRYWQANERTGQYLDDPAAVEGSLEVYGLHYLALRWLDRLDTLPEPESVLIDDEPGWVLRFSYENGDQKEHYFDRETGRLVKTIRIRGERNREYRFIYSTKRIDGIVFVARVEFEIESQTSRGRRIRRSQLNVEHIDFDTPLDEVDVRIPPGLPLGNKDESK